MSPLRSFYALFAKPLKINTIKQGPTFTSKNTEYKIGFIGKIL